MNSAGPHEKRAKMAMVYSLLIRAIIHKGLLFILLRVMDSGPYEYWSL